MSNYSYFWSIPPIDISWDTKYNRWCKSVKKKLAENDIEASVHRHILFGKELYLISINENGYVSIRDICDALDIPSSWVDLYEYHGKEKCFALDECKFNDKYLKDNKIVFEEFKLVNECGVRPDHIITQRLKEKLNENAKAVRDDNLIFIYNTSMNAELHAKALNINEDAVMDVSVNHLSNDCDDGLKMIIDVRRVK